MRVSQYYNLDRTQASLDFLDVDIYNDIKLYIDPYAFEIIPSEFSDRCKYYIQNYFDTLLNYIRIGDNSSAQAILLELREPNETHLGVSQEASKGRGLGPFLASKVLSSLQQSEAVQTGLLQSLEESALLIRGVGYDIISDIVTNIIRAELILYTQCMAEHYNIPMEDNVASGPMWNPETKRWYTNLVRLPKTDRGPLLLVPKAIVRKKTNYDIDEYYNHYVLDFLRSQEFRANSGLIEILKNGKERITKKSLEAKYGTEKKEVSIRETLRHPEILETYRETKADKVSSPLDHEELAIIENSTMPDLQKLFENLQKIPKGKKDADAYEKVIEQLISAIFYPDLMYPKLQHNIHDGRKRIDIKYTNIAQKGFFYWLALNYPASHIYIECKNYSLELKNPEFDQLSGRFSPSRGKFGLLVCRNITDKELAIQRCIDTAKDDRGYILILEDNDFEELVDIRQSLDYNNKMFSFFQRKFEKLVM
ncbi:hypothetical protein [Sulfurovum sp.]|uniref:hypothetical protein n=1 Tax=Sulfurovum sp. TaxID=1969726 RepID=UPI003567C005